MAKKIAVKKTIPPVKTKKTMPKSKPLKKASLKTTETILDPKDYVKTLTALKIRVQEAQIKATLAANKELILLYWHIGQTLAEKQKMNGWGSGVIDKLALDLQNAFPGLGGFSRANIFKMRAFFIAYEIVSQAVRQLDELPIFMIPWGHNVILVTKIKNNEERLWYAQNAIKHGWSRTILEMQIESNLYGRKGKAVTNFLKTLPSPHSDMAQQSLKDPYLFDFLTLRDGYLEKELEQGLIDHIQKFLLELGEGFSFFGRQYHLAVGSRDYYIDLLFYHTRLRCYVVVELKTTEFEPEYAGKLNFYLSAVDDMLRHQDDKPTIGLLLCKTKDNFSAEYALRDINKPIGVAEYATKLVEKLPKNLKGSLPSIEEIEAELEKREALIEAQMDSKKRNRKN